MYTINHKIAFSETDPGGILFFAEFLKIAHRAYEAFFLNLDLERNYFLDDTYVLPIVHTSADFLSPVKFGDEILCQVQVSNIGVTSFELQYELMNGDKLAARVVTKHVTVLKNGFKKAHIPEELLAILKENQN